MYCRRIVTSLESLRRTLRSPKILIIIPADVYFLAYLYLAWYHKKVWLFETIVHESGALNLTQVIFYSSHFIGHIPVDTALAFLFTGSYFWLACPPRGHFLAGKALWLGLILAAFLACCLFLSLWLFGIHDTIAYAAQRKQGVYTCAAGGSWNLHLPSTLMQVLLIPVYVFCAVVLFKRRRTDSVCAKVGKLYFFLGLAFTFLLTLALNPNLIGALGLVWSDPRYLAHSVRELCTFPLTYYPLPLFVFLGRDEQSVKYDKSMFSPGMLIVLIVFMMGLAYQAYIPLSHGIGELAQKPSFATGGKLGIPYLLAAHYFEHFLDMIYFFLLSLLLFAIHARR